MAQVSELVLDKLWKKDQGWPLYNKHQKALVWQGKKRCETKEPMWRTAAKSVRWEAPAAKHALWFCLGVEEHRGEARREGWERSRGGGTALTDRHIWPCLSSLPPFQSFNLFSPFYWTAKKGDTAAEWGSAGIFWAAQPLAWWPRKTCQMPV